MNVLTFDCESTGYLNFNFLFKGLPCKRITEDFCIDYTRTPYVPFNYDYGLAGDYIVNDNGRLEIFTAEQIEGEKQ